MRNITDSPDYYLGNELVKVVNNINVSSRNYVKEISLRYQKKHGYLKKEVVSLKVKEHLELYKTPFTHDNFHK